MKDSAYCPFETVDNILKELPAAVKTILVDFHSEASSEKLAMAYHLDGRVTAVLGTHTHIQTADARILAGGTAALSDTGMCGAEYSVLGREVASVLKKFTSGMPVRLPVVENGIIRVDGAAISYDHLTGKALEITPFSRSIEL
jgi:calcineurin-like phosphoesterase